MIHLLPLVSLFMLSLLLVSLCVWDSLQGTLDAGAGGVIPVSSLLSPSAANMKGKFECHVTSFFSSYDSAWFLSLKADGASNAWLPSLQPNVSLYTRCKEIELNMSDQEKSHTLCNITIVSHFWVLAWLFAYIHIHEWIRPWRMSSVLPLFDQNRCLPDTSSIFLRLSWKETILESGCGCKCFKYVSLYSFPLLLPSFVSSTTFLRAIDTFHSEYCILFFWHQRR